MTTHSHSHRDHATADGTRPRRAPVSSAHDAKMQLVSDGVVASYIHDISTRRRAPRAAVDGTAATELGD